MTNVYSRQRIADMALEAARLGPGQVNPFPEVEPAHAEWQAAYERYLTSDEFEGSAA